jgi:BarA-like signal transduction histidine kinase
MTQGAAACLPKPVEREKLIHVLNEVIPDRLTPHPDQTGITSHQLEMEPR